MTQTLRRQYVAANEPNLNSFQDLFARQKRHFATGVTRSYEWRIEQLDRMGRLLAENDAALQQAVARDFKTASQEYVLETLACLSEVAFQKSQLKDWMAPVESTCAAIAGGDRASRRRLSRPIRRAQNVVRILKRSLRRE